MARPRFIGAVDDATGTVPAALFREQEDAAGYLAMLRAEGPGIPPALYVDRHGIFTKRASERLSLEEEPTGTRLPTEVGRALDRSAFGRRDARSQRAPDRADEGDCPTGRTGCLVHGNRGRSS